MTAPRLAVVGSANCDLVVRCAHLPAPGETVLGGDVIESPGGKGANQAAALAALGANVSFLGAVGADPAGDSLVNSLAARGVDVSLVQRSTRPTGTALIAVDDQGENFIVVSSGANQTLDLGEIDLAAYDLVLTQLEIGDAVLEDVVNRSRVVVLNVAPARTLAAGLAERCAVVIANEIEAASLDSSGLAHCVVTLGAQGAVTLRRGVEECRVTPPEVESVDTVGAGDVFCAAYAWRFAQRASDRDALAFAVTAGALATRAPGAQGALPTTQEVTTWLARVS